MKQTTWITTKEITEMALLVALAIILNLPGLSFTIQANGGSISLTTLPLIILALRLGPIKGFVGIGIVYGLITNLIDGYGFATYPLDYLLAYGSISIAGFFGEKILKPNLKNPLQPYLWLLVAVFLGTLGRLVFAIISGIVVFNTDFYFSFIYNLSYIFPSFVLVVAVLIPLLKPFQKINLRYPVSQ
jgi:thiamine transporter